MPSGEINAETQEIPLSDLRPVELLFQYLELPPSPVEESNSVGKRVSLGAWLEGAIASGWQTVEDLLDPQPAFNFRSLDLSKPLKTPKSAVSGKLLKLAPSTQVALLVGILQSDALHFDIWVKLCPRGDGSPSEWPFHCILPENLEVRVLDGRDTVVMEAQSRQTDMLQLNFRGVLNEHFSVEVSLNGVSLVEEFAI